MGGAAMPAAIGMQAAGGLFSAANQYAAGGMNQKYFNYLSDTAKTNAGLAEQAGKADQKNLNAEALSEEAVLARKAGLTIGSEKTALSVGAGSSSRTAQDIVKSSLNQINIDEENLRRSVAFKSKGIDISTKTQVMNDMSQAGGYDLAGSNAMRAARMQSIGSILGSGGSVASSWYMMS